MELFQVQYELKSNNKSFTAAIVAHTKEKAIDKIYRRVGAIKVNTLSARGVVHAFDDEIVDMLINKSGKIDKFKSRINERNEIIRDYEVELSELQAQMESYQKQIDKYQQTPAVSSKDLKNALKGKQTTKIIYACPYCEFETEKKQGVKMHMSKKHKK